MPKSVTFNRGLSSVLFWSVISAAFIGPGTVTTASNAGATFGLDLLWALVFSIFATIILQEAAARVTIASGMNLGEILARRYERNSRWVRWILFGTIVFGCAAYQAGNILGAISGLGLFSEIPRQWLTLVLCLLAAALLWWGNTAWITRILGAAVALMGIAFIWSAFSGNLGFGAWLDGMRPRVNNGNALLVIGLIGTTIVPYNLFLASGISKGQRIQEMRWGVVIAIIIGGIISAAIMAVGTQVNGPFSFAALSQAMELKMGASGAVLFGFGLFAAGLSSAITSPFAAAITGQSLMGSGRKAWSSKGKYFRLTWAGVISAGLILGTLDVKPVPAIILAQAVNGILLPVVAVFLTLAVNDRQLIPREFLNTTLVNALTLMIVLIASFLGLNNLWRAAVQVIPRWNAHPNWGWMTAGAGSLIILFWLGRQIFKQ